MRVNAYDKHDRLRQWCWRPPFAVVEPGGLSRGGRGERENAAAGSNALEHNCDALSDADAHRDSAYRPFVACSWLTAMVASRAPLRRVFLSELGPARQRYSNLRFVCHAAQCLLEGVNGLTALDQVSVVDDDRGDGVNSVIEIEALASAHLSRVLV